jgi:hypothetical protein
MLLDTVMNQDQFKVKVNDAATCMQRHESYGFCHVYKSHTILRRFVDVREFSCLHYMINKIIPTPVCTCVCSTSAHKAMNKNGR